MDIFSKFTVKEDSYGNKLLYRWILNEQKKITHVIIHLKTQKDTYARQIAFMDYDTRTITFKRVTDKHFNKKFDGFGVNWNVLEDDFLGVKNVHLVVDHYTTEYLFDRSVYVQNAKFTSKVTDNFCVEAYIPMQDIVPYQIGLADEVK
jgi:hypothetical protein